MIARASNGVISYRLFATSLDAGQTNIQLVDQWMWLDQNSHAPDELQMSYQLISSEWDNVAQLDLPLVHEGVPRRFSIDVSDVEPGDYRLVAILYNSETGERTEWRENFGAPPGMLPLAEIVIPERR